MESKSVGNVAYPILENTTIVWDEEIDKEFVDIVGTFWAAMYQVYNQVRETPREAKCTWTLEEYILGVDLYGDRLPEWVVACLATAVPVWRCYLDGSGYIPGNLVEFSTAFNKLLEVLQRLSDRV